MVCEIKTTQRDQSGLSGDVDSSRLVTLMLIFNPNNDAIVECVCFCVYVYITSRYKCSMLGGERTKMI